MRFSIITPTHDPRYLEEAYQSLAEQTFQEWEWIIVPNGAAKHWGQGKDAPAFLQDSRVRVVPFGYDLDRVGALKHFACTQARGEIIVEFDHDDVLMPTALEVLDREAVAHPETDFFYSNCATIQMAGNGSIQWDASYGWTYRAVQWRGVWIMEARSPEPDPQNISRIWFAPNHFRAWRKSAYDAIGGYDQSMSIADDHDLICRFFLAGKLHHIDECLYVYRVHDDNTWLQRREAIQVAMWKNHDKYLLPMMEQWSRARQLELIDLCGGLDKPAGYCSVDLQNADILADLDGTWPMADNSVGVLRAFDAVEHLRDPIHTMNEAYRVLAHGGLLAIQVPSTNGKGAFRDPTHVSFWNDQSFWYYTNEKYARYIRPRYQGRFQALKIEEKKVFGIDYAIAHLIALKDKTPRYYGELLI